MRCSRCGDQQRLLFHFLRFRCEPSGLIVSLGQCAARYGSLPTSTALYPDVNPFSSDQIGQLWCVRLKSIASIVHLCAFLRQQRTSLTRRRTFFFRSLSSTGTALSQNTRRSQIKRMSTCATWSFPRRSHPQNSRRRSTTLTTQSKLGQIIWQPTFTRAR
jgi:hypothetical protein